MTLTLGFEEDLCASLELSGGKGANLARLTRHGFPVPAGFVVTASAYREFIAGDEELGRFLAAFGSDDPARLRARSQELCSRLASRPLPEAVTAEVRKRLAHFERDRAFSVRSSSTMEDLAGAAFAGQHDTYLNCSGEEEILRRIRDCYVSLWGDRAVAYRREQGFDHRQAAMAVVVQTMVRCEVAGVGFSVNPIRGDLGEMIVDANYGLGESVVSGEAEVDHWTIDKKSRAVREARIAAKSRKIVCAERGTREVRLSAEEGAAPALDAAALGKVAEMLAAVEASYRFPQDIEWGIEGGRVHLLQSRPITTIPPRWTRDESAERFPNVVTPLTWDFVEEGFHRSLEHSLRLMGFPPFHGQWFGLHGHYVYGNQNAVHLYLSQSPLEMRSLEDLSGRLERLRHEFRWVQELPLRWTRDLDHYLLTLGQLAARPLEDESLADVWGFVLEVQELGAQYFLPNIAISITHGLLYRFLHRFLASAVGSERAPAVFDALLAWCDTKTGTINREIWEMARSIRAEPALEAALVERPSREFLESKALSRFPRFEARLAKFLRDHGHREIDFDAYQPTWVEVPWVVLDNLRLVLAGSFEQDPIDQEADLKIRMQQAELEVYGKLPRELHYFFTEILRLARVYTSLDDLEHYQTTRLTLPLRKGLGELGNRLARRDVIAEPMDVFFARRELLDRAIRGNDSATWKEVATSVAAEKRAYVADRERKPAWTLGDERPAAAPDGAFLTGLPGSPGTAEGEAFLVLGSDDFARFPKGAVLVARTTNPTWTPLFYCAAAVVTESGGPLSHGAVTAREMKIPAVMSVRDCLSRLSNGRRVRVEGTEGRVVLL
jgi:pyruvate,water dikinase